MKKPFKFRFGPGAMVTAAFIGPGTITTCSIAGAKFGYALLWGLLFSIIATIVLQEMSARLGIITRQGLGEALRKQFTNKFVKVISVILVISAIVIGNAAFETGNLLGASLGADSIFDAFGINIGVWAAVLGGISFILLFIGSYKLIERVLIGLVILMSLAFITAAIVVSPDWKLIFKGMVIPSLPGGSLLTIAGLIGTTVVPYNLFLHASTVQQKWKGKADLPEARLDTFVSVILGGIISMAIVVTSAVAFFGNSLSLNSGADLGMQLEPLFGRWSRYFIGTGLFAAGISSAITAPLAAAYAAAGIFGWEKNLKSARFRSIWIFILLTGTIFAAYGFKPLEAILFAQAANGILLPVIAFYLLWTVNSKKIMGENRNGLLSNIIGIIVVLIALGIGSRSLLHVFGIL